MTPMTEPVTEPVVSLEQVNFAYGAVPVLSDLSLEVGRGEFVGLVGPNAGGKSTLLKLILGLLRPQSGRILVLGRPPREARRRLGYVSQHPTFSRGFPISVEQLVLMGRLGLGPALGWYGAADRAAARAALGEVEALDLAGRRVGTLSGGQLQRVLLARALVGEPEVLILDEPTANIDQRVEGDIFELLAALNARLTILVVSHDIAFISGYVGRVLCLNRTLMAHDTAAIDADLIHRLYHAEVRAVDHHSCGGDLGHAAPRRGVALS